MKLISCYIENFGKLHACKYHFNEGLNTLCQENGWGKTTLMTFIKAMFYGLNTYKGNDLEQNERKKYLPWQGGNFGGYLEFTTNNKIYRVTRFFGKTPTSDTCEIIEIATGQKTQDYTSNLGNELFHLDLAGFERTLFLPQKIFETMVTTSITNQLTNILHGTNQDFAYDNAIKKIDNRRRELTNQQRTGIVDRLQSELETNNYRLEELQHELMKNPPIENTNFQAPTNKLSSQMKILIGAMVALIIAGVISAFWSLTAMIIGVVAGVIVGLIIMIKFRYKAITATLGLLSEQQLHLATALQTNANIKATIRELENRNQEIEPELQNFRKELEIVQFAQSFLTQANTNLNNQYRPSLQKNFLKYLEQLTGQKFDNLLMDTDLNVQFTEYGMLRNHKYYSRGYQNLYELCLRLALIETLFQNSEPPFIVLDDPFVNFDAAKISRIKEFINKLTPTWQIIYCTCHESRC